MPQRIEFSANDLITIEKLYLIDKLSSNQIANIFGVSKGTILHRLRELNIVDSDRPPNTIYFTDDQLIEMAKLYEVDGYSSRQLAKLYGVSKFTILKTLREIGIEVKYSPPKVYFTEDEWLEMGKLYLEGYTLKEIGSMFGGIHGKSVERYIKRIGVATRPSKKYSANYRYFNEINSEKPAYWLGFIVTDGSLTPDDVRIGLAPKDIDHIQKFLDDIESNHPVRIYKVKSGYSIALTTIWSTDMVNDLAKYGIVPNKTFIAEPYYDIDPNLARHFWRAVVDGDGYISKDNRPAIEICGTLAICEGFRKWCQLYTPSQATVRPFRNIFRYGLGSNMAIPVIRELYRDCNIYLDRKYERAMRILDKFG